MTTKTVHMKDLHSGEIFELPADTACIKVETFDADADYMSMPADYGGDAASGFLEIGEEAFVPSEDSSYDNSEPPSYDVDYVFWWRSERLA